MTSQVADALFRVPYSGLSVSLRPYTTHHPLARALSSRTSGNVRNGSKVPSPPNFEDSVVRSLSTTTFSSAFLS